MKISSGSTDRKMSFVALDASGNRLTGLSSFTVYRSRNGGTATAYTTPTVAELSAANMPGVYVLTIDEDTTVDSGHDFEEYVVHVTASGMMAVTRAIEIERVKFTEGQSATMANSAVDADVERIQGAVVDTGSGQLGCVAVSIGAGAIGASQIANNAFTGTKFATDCFDSDNFHDSVKTEMRSAFSGTATGGTTSTLADTGGLTQTNTDYWKGMTLLMTSGSNAGISRMITGFNITLDTLTVSPAFPNAVANGDTYEILPHGPADVELWRQSQPNTLTTGQVSSNVSSMDANVVTASAIANDAITAAKIATGAIDADAIADGAIDAGAIATGAIDADAIANSAIHTGALAIGAVRANAIEDDAYSNIRSEVFGTADSGSTTTLTAASLTQSQVDHFKGAWLFMQDGNNRGLARLITGFNPGTDTITVTPAFPNAIAGGDRFEVHPAGRMDLHMWKGAVPQDLSVDLVKTEMNASTANSINAATLATDTITAAKIAADAIGASELAADAVAEIQSGLATSAALANVQSDTDDIQTRLPAALVSGRIDASVGAMAANTLTASALATDAAEEISDTVWDEPIAGHLTAGTTGKALSDASSGGSAPTVGQIADAVWDEDLSGHTTAGTGGANVGQRLDVAVSTRATPAQVNAEVNDVLNVDTFAQPGQEAPAATTTLGSMLRYLYKWLRNKVTQSAGEFKVFADDGTTVDHKATTTDDGTTFTRGEIGSGP